MPKTTTTPHVMRPGSGVIMPNSELQKISYMLSNISGRDGVRVSTDINGGIRIHGPGNAPDFSGTAYVAGQRTTGLTSDDNKPWVKCDLSTGVATEETGPPTIPFPDGEEWFEKANTSGDIHVSRS